MPPLSLRFAAVVMLWMPASVQAQERVTLSVLTWNVWAVRGVSDDIDERLALVPGAVAGTDVDVALIQEVWDPDDAAELERGFHRAGYEHVDHYADTPSGSSGLLIASRLEVRSLGFSPFTAGRVPHTLWHLDWYGSKGLARWSIDTALGRVVLANTHLQAKYQTDDYAVERLSQSLEVVMESADRAWPIIFGGDFNSTPGEAPRAALEELGGFIDASAQPALDAIFVRNGLTVALATTRAERLLTERVDIGIGEPVPLSDHPAVLIEVELSRCDDCAPIAEPPIEPRRRAAATLRGAAADLAPKLWAARLFPVLTLALIGAWLWRRRPSPPATFARRWAVRAFIAIVVVACVWSAYVGSIYYPALIDGLDAVADRLG